LHVDDRPSLVWGSRLLTITSRAAFAIALAHGYITRWVYRTRSSWQQLVHEVDRQRRGGAFLLDDLGKAGFGRRRVRRLANGDDPLTPPASASKSTKARVRVKGSSGRDDPA